MRTQAAWRNWRLRVIPSFLCEPVVIGYTMDEVSPGVYQYRQIECTRLDAR